MPTRAAVTPISSAPAPELQDHSLYNNRELSLLAFQRRVLEEAEDESNPLLDRIKFLAILGSNLDEFFMVRVAGLIDQLDAGTIEVGADAMSPAAQLGAVRAEVQRLMSDAHRCLQQKLLPMLAEAGIRIHRYSDLDAGQAESVRQYFESTIFPVLTPLAFDPSRPFPHISNLSVNLAVLIRDPEGNERFARLKVPDTLPALIPSNPQAHSRRRFPQQELDFVWIEDVIAANLEALFPGMTILQVHPFHVTRDAEMAIKELEAEDLLETIEEGVRRRRFGSVVRLKVTSAMPADILEILANNLEIEESDVYRIEGVLSLKRLMALYQLDRPDLKEHPFVPFIPRVFAEEEDIFAAIRQQDILLHHPFDSFQPVVDFLRKAAHDPQVLAIKMTLYRVGRNSPVVEALLEAMEYGKQVAVLVELKARFDEESNIEWARALEREGVHVVYGLVGLKIHGKVALVVRKEGDQIRRYVHLATGNYNAVSASLYTDFGLFTANPEIAGDVTHLFNFLTGYSGKSDYQKLAVAPLNLRYRLESLIDREIAHQVAGRPGHMIFKMNALADPVMIQALYRASQAGVKVDLLVRGACSLRPGVPGVSDNIRVTSIVGRFLEHSRGFYFLNGGDEEVYLSSADLLSRNLNRRVEILFPLRDPRLVQRVRDEVLGCYLLDNVKARRLESDGSYSRVIAEDGAKPVNAQETLLRKIR